GAGVLRAKGAFWRLVLQARGTMSSRALSHVLRGGLNNSARQIVRGGGYHHRPPPPPFARLAPPANRLHEEAELYAALKHLAYALGGFATLMGVVTLYDPNSLRKASPRGNHLPDLKWELGEASEPEGEFDE
ncbi:TPA: hypothetical protein N0F65_000283, partial [Lagenidium giganteum]